MWATERRRRILEILNARRQVSAGTLADLLGVSRETVRRDLVEMEKEGRLTRVHGGAVLSPQTSELPFRKRLNTKLREKREIARKAAGLIRPGQCVMVDAGTTTSVFARELIRVPDIMVVTNSIDIATTIQNAKTTIELVLLGGTLVSDVPGTYGAMTLAEIERFRADMAFVAPVALDAAEGAFDFELHEAEVAGMMVAQARQVVMLVDHGKLGVTSRVRYCRPEEIDILVTDTGAPAEMTAAFQQAGIRVLA